MKATELIAKLQALIELHGDLDVATMVEANAYIPDDVTCESLPAWQKKACGINLWFLME